MAEAQEERTEEATQNRRDEFRRKGQVAQTRELATALVLLVTAGSIYALSKLFITELMNLFSVSFGVGLSSAIRNGDFMTAGVAAGQKLAFLFLPAVGTALLISLGSSLLQVGFLSVDEALGPDFDRINPIEGLTRLTSFKNLVEGFKSFLKVLIIGLICYFVIRSEISYIPLLGHLSVPELGAFLGRLSAKLFSCVGMAILGLAAADYFVQRWDLEKRMMMTKQEVREENRSREGDPLIKARIRKIQREVANRRMMAKVPKSDVIVTNPTHIAVALKYDSSLPAPQVVAKGADYLAEKIKAIAKEHSIPIVENKPLARTLFKTLKVGQLIPRELYVAVAEVLSYVYKLKRKFARRGSAADAFARRDSATDAFAGRGPKADGLKGIR